MSEFLLGTSGYDYPEWKGVFYPLDLKRKDFLSYYATKFNAVELNNTFYNMPAAGRLLSFYERSEGRLKFSIKANRLLTHEISSIWQNAADDFRKAVNPLAQKDVLSALLFQFPQSFHYTKENRIYLAKMIAAFEGFPIVIEFRHKEWIRESVFEGLEQRNASLAFCDMPQLKFLPDGTFVGTPFIGNTAYIRLHGRNAGEWYSNALEKSVSASANSAAHNGSERCRYNYSDAELSEFVPIIKNAVKARKRVQVYFNNHPDGSGAKNAERLGEMVEKYK